MAADVRNREVSRDALAALLSTALTGSGKPVVEVFGYKPRTLSGRGPYVLVLAAGTRRAKKAIGSVKRKNHFRLLIVTLVLDASADDSWTPQQVDDTLDLVDKEIADTIADNERTNDWHNLDLDDEFSVIAPTKEFGANYMSESRIALVEVHDA